MPRSWRPDNLRMTPNDVQCALGVSILNTCSLLDPDQRRPPLLLNECRLHRKQSEERKIEKRKS